MSFSPKSWPGLKIVYKWATIGNILGVEVPYFSLSAPVDCFENQVKSTTNSESYFCSVSELLGSDCDLTDLTTSPNNKFKI